MLFSVYFEQSSSCEYYWCFNGDPASLPVVHDLTEIAWKFILRLTDTSWEMISCTIAFSLFPMEHMVDMLYVFYSVVLNISEQFSDSVLDFFSSDVNK